MRLGAAVKDLRRKAGLRQEDLAERVGLTQSYLSQIENDRKEPNLSTLRQIGGELGVSLPILFFLSMDEEDVRPERKEAFDRIFPHLKDLIESQLLADA
jgi:transcriptional regulator with XRE-family HTH domain